MSVIGNPLLLTPEGYQISRSVRLRSSASAFFNRTPASASNRKTWTWSGWVKRGALSRGVDDVLFDARSSAGGVTHQTIHFATSSDALRIRMWNGSSHSYQLITTQVFRDPSAWYHVVVAFDSTQATDTNRVKLYVNGAQVSSFSTASYPSLNLDGYVNDTGLHNLGTYGYTSTDRFDGYLTEVNFIDGQALTPSSFGETDAVTGVWKPKKYAGTYGTNGFYLNFSDPSAATAAAIGKDYSGNGNNWTPNNISVTAGATYDSMIDVPTPYADGGNGRGNYCVVNPLLKGGNLTIAAANLNINSTGSAWTTAYGTFLIPTTGKWYWEVTAGGVNTNPGIVSAASNLAGNLSTYPADTLVSYTYYGSSGNKITGPGNTSAAYGASFTTNDVIGIAFDADAGTLTFYKNNTSQGTAFSGLTAQYVSVFGVYDSGVQAVNFGQRPFAYTPPTGFKALNTQNLPEPTIVDGGEYFNPVTYSGNNGTQSITGVGFAPDWVWIKVRNEVNSHYLFDQLRGADQALFSDSTSAEVDYSATGRMTSFDSDGFTVKYSSSTGTNASGDTYVAWNWKANGAGVSNTDGSITSTVSANTTAGFSIVTYTGTGANATVGHGLGVAPKMIIVKNRGIADNWRVWHSDIGGANRHLVLNATSAISTAANFFTAVPTSTEFTVGSDDAVNKVSTNLVAYCFAEVPGFSKFGSYTGNGSADGPFVFCGFRPRFIMTKRTDTSGFWWEMVDTAREPANPSDQTLYANVSDSEYTSSVYDKDLLSNGFKMRGTNGGHNASGGTYIFMAFAENPTKYALAR